MRVWRGDNDARRTFDHQVGMFRVRLRGNTATGRFMDVFAPLFWFSYFCIVATLVLLGAWYALMLVLTTDDWWWPWLSNALNLSV